MYTVTYLIVFYITKPLNFITKKIEEDSCVYLNDDSVYILSILQSIQDARQEQRKCSEGKGIQQEEPVRGQGEQEGSVSNAYGGY